MRTLVMVVLAAVLAFNVAPASTANATDNQALAEGYAKEAAEAEAQAVKHEKMAESYKGAGKVGQYHINDHCKTIAKRYREQAKDLNALSAALRAEGK